MEIRKNASLFAVLAGFVLASGCAYAPAGSGFRTALLPPATPQHTESVALPHAVHPLDPNIKEVPPFLNSTGELLERVARQKDLIDQANARYQRGTRMYWRRDTAGARKEFDAAIGLLLEAAEASPTDREAYGRRLDKMVDDIHRLDLAGMGAGVPVDQAQFDKAPIDDIIEMTFPVDPNLNSRVREQVAASVSQLPLSVNDAVLSYITYFNNRGHKTALYGRARSGRYRPMIQRVLDEEGVPQELIYLAQAESGFMPRAMSRKAAGGMWQFLASRGREYGLMRTSLTDDRMDPERATRSAARHLRDLYEEFGDWYLAIAAYNCGPVAIEKAVERTGYADFWELRRRGAIPGETSNYVPIILALTIMEKNAAEYNLDSVPLDAPLEYDTVEMTSLTSLALVADITETPLTELAALNPALLKSMAPEGYGLHVPKGMGNQLVAALQMVPAEHRDGWRMHRVGPGETLETIGKRYGAAQSEIIAVNKLESAEVAEGDHLLIPASPAPAVTVRTASRKSSGKKTQTASSRKSSGKQTTSASTGKSKGKTTSASTSSKSSKPTKSAKASANSGKGASTAGTRHKTPSVTRTASR